MQRLQDTLELCTKGWQDEQGEMAICEALHSLLPGLKPMTPYRYTQDMNAALMIVPTLPSGCRVQFKLIELELGQHTATVHTSQATASYPAFALVIASLKAALAA